MRIRLVSFTNSLQNSLNSSSFQRRSCIAPSTRVSTSSRLIVSWLAQTPRSRAPLHPRRVFEYIVKPRPHRPQCVRPENRYTGRAHLAPVVEVGLGELERIQANLDGRPPADGQRALRRELVA